MEDKQQQANGNNEKKRTRGQNADEQMSKATWSEKQDEQMTMQNKRRDKTKNEWRGEGRQVDDSAKKKNCRRKKKTCTKRTSGTGSER